MKTIELNRLSDHPHLCQVLAGPNANERREDVQGVMAAMDFFPKNFTVYEVLSWQESIRERINRPQRLTQWGEGPISKVFQKSDMVLMNYAYIRDITDRDELVELFKQVYEKLLNPKGVLCIGLGPSSQAAIKSFTGKHKIESKIFKTAPLYKDYPQGDMVVKYEGKYNLLCSYISSHYSTIDIRASGRKLASFRVKNPMKFRFWQSQELMDAAYDAGFDVFDFVARNNNHMGHYSTETPIKLIASL